MTGASLSPLQRANAAAAAATLAPNLPAALVAASTGSNLGTTASEINKVRIVHVSNRLALHLRGGFRSDPFEFFQLCFALARGIDYAVSHSDVPSNVQELPPLIKQVYERRSEAFLQSAIMVLLISAKNACRDGWFKAADSHELLNMANEISSNFCMADSVTPESINVLQVTSNVISRFYPFMKLNRLLASFEVKPGYEILVADIYISRNISTEERIRLFVAQSDDAATSNCIITPPHVNFLINGKAVERRTNISMDNGPQLPSDITKMLKYGMNLFQAIGSFTVNYAIAIAVTSAVNSSDTHILQDYDASAVATVPSDSEVIEGPSRISLSCPISFKRIKVPVKGHLCKHHQCFDFDNFMDMNSRKPSWRCPHCNQSVSYIDIRLDQHMVKILREAGDDVSDVVISADGSWKAAEKQQGNMAQLPNKTLSGHSEPTAPCDPSGFDGLPSSVVDLTTEDDLEDDEIMSSAQLDRLTAIPYQDESGLCETNDRKPTYADLQGLFASSVQPLLDASELSQTTQQLSGETGPRNLSQPHVSVQTIRRQPPNLPARQTTSQATSTFTQPSRLIPVQVQEASFIATGLAARAGKPASTISADIRAAQVARLHSGATSLQTPPAMPSPQMPPDNRPRATNFAEVPLEQNWRPTGRMRGSLTGGAYSAAISRYLAQPTQPSTPPSAHSTANAGSNQNSVLASSSAALPKAHQTNLSSGGSR